MSRVLGAALSPSAQVTGDARGSAVEQSVALEGRFGFRRSGRAPGTPCSRKGLTNGLAQGGGAGRLAHPLPASAHTLLRRWMLTPCPAGPRALGQTPGRSRQRCSQQRRRLLQCLFAALRLHWCRGCGVWLSPGERRSDTGLQPPPGGSEGCRCWFCSGEDPGDVHGPGSLRVSDHRPQQQLHALLHGPVAGFQRNRPDNRCSPPGTPRAVSPGETGGLWLKLGGPQDGGEQPLCRAARPGWA